eukprot:CAMPEP_0176193224 /NCGR_PEP_ID=MMETSP0121_2-20121125/5374_1 /TAXON_ID=160619 /ORGANISM="Kryptoperidinium foliaceum, Strain CCMP 1326" /LENGTH=158 /DNA_ID=CAMNT_0017531931 /DNA_START=27 /DNA_END=501 /DNA_ORIENTATION=-
MNVRSSEDAQGISTQQSTKGGKELTGSVGGGAISNTPRVPVERAQQEDCLAKRMQVVENHATSGIHTAATLSMEEISAVASGAGGVHKWCALWRARFYCKARNAMSTTHSATNCLSTTSREADERMPAAHALASRASSGVGLPCRDRLRAELCRRHPP